MAGLSTNIPYLNTIYSFKNAITVGTENADYITDGTDDDVQINEAMTEIASNGGGRVLIKEGTYQISDEILVPSNVIIEGVGYGTKLQRKTGSTDYLVNIFGIYSKDNVRITNLHIDSQKQDIIDNYVSTAQDGSHIYDTCNGIYITGDGSSRDNPSTYITIDNCYIHDAYYGNIGVNDCNGFNIVNNYIYHGRDNQINARVNGYGGYTRNAVVNGNIIYGEGPIATQNQFSGIQFLRGQNISITGNLVYGLGNTETTEGNGIGLEGCRHVTITGNNIHHNLVQGVKISKTVEGQPAYWDQNETYIENEYVYYNTRIFYALQNNQGQTPPSTATSDSYWQYQASGSVDQLSNDVVVANNIIANNNYYGEEGVISLGIFYEKCDNVSIVGNKLYGNTRGISNGENVGNASIVNNIVEESEQVGIALYNDYLQRAMPVIRGNTVIRSGQKGIDSVVAMVCDGNLVEANGQAGISVQVSGTPLFDNPYVLVSNNVLRDNADSGILVNSGIASSIPIDIRFNYAPPSDIQPRGLGENGSGAYCVGNRFIGQTNEAYYFTDTDSVWRDLDAEYLSIGGGTMTGDINMGGNEMRSTRKLHAPDGQNFDFILGGDTSSSVFSVGNKSQNVFGFRVDATGSCFIDNEITVKGKATFNADAGSIDFQVKSDTENDMFFVRGGSNTVGVGYFNPNARFGIKGAGTGTGRTLEIVNSSGGEIASILDNGTMNLNGTLQADGLRIDVTPTSETITPTHTITISINGTDYKIPIVAA